MRLFLPIFTFFLANINTVPSVAARTTFSANNTSSFVKQEATTIIGKPNNHQILAPRDVPVNDGMKFLTVCIDVNFSGPCITYIYIGPPGPFEGCVNTENEYKASISSLQVLTPNTACTFFMGTECQGASVHSANGISDLRRYQMNDDIMSLNCRYMESGEGSGSDNNSMDMN